MLKHYYQMTILEEFVENAYFRNGITDPEQLTVNELAYRLNVWVHYRPVGSRALEAVSGMYSMFLDERLPPEQQRLDFLHELCHLLRHAGNQMIMPKAIYTDARARSRTVCNVRCNADLNDFATYCPQRK